MNNRRTILNVAFLTAGGMAPCLSSTIATLIEEYTKYRNDIQYFGYMYGYKGLLTGAKVTIPNHPHISELKKYGGSFLGNSRVKLTNKNDCINRGYIKKDQNPLAVAANQIKNDKIDILHTIGGDDTNTTAGDLVKYLSKINYNLSVIGLPKTIDNDVYPIKQTLGAYTAAEQASLFFQNIVNENTTSSRQLIIHEIMGRNCGWLTAYSCYLYRKQLHEKKFIPELLFDKKRWDIHAIYIPENKFNLNREVDRLNPIMDDNDCVNIFLSEGAGIENIIHEMQNNKEEIKYDAFGHIRLDEINPGRWYGQYFKEKLDCDKVLVQKSGYFSRSANPNQQDLDLIYNCSSQAVKYALDGKNGVVGISDFSDKVELIDFSEIRGGKTFNVASDWFVSMLKDINQI